MKQLYFITQGIYIPKYINEKSEDGYYYPGNGGYIYKDENEIEEYIERNSAQYNDFNSLYEAAKSDKIVRTFVTQSPFRKKKQVYFGFYWSYHFDIKLKENKSNDCFPVKTKFKYRQVKNLSISDIADRLTADEFIEYCLERGMNAYALSK